MIPNRRLAGWVCIAALTLSSVVYGIFLYSEHRMIQRMPSMSDSEIRSTLMTGMTTTDVANLLGEPLDKSDHGSNASWTYYNKPPENHPESSTRIFIIFTHDRIKSLILKSPKLVSRD